MKEIGRGWQFAVYDLGEGRVLKRPLTGFERFLRVGRQMLFRNPLAIPSEVRRVRTDMRDSLEIVRNSRGRLPPHLLGNPIIGDDDSYRQDKAAVLAERFSEATAAESFRIIDAYTELTRELWKYGVADRVFNFTINNALDSSGRVILIDLGELTDSKEKVRKHIETKAWLRHFSYRSLPDELKRYFASAMDRGITLENLEREWLEGQRT